MSQGGILNLGDGGGGLAASLTPDIGAPVPAVGGTIPTLGQQAGTVHAVETNNDGAGNLRIEDRTWQTQYVVDPSATIGLRGTFQTIQAAINQAASDGASLTVQKEIYIRYGAYTENLTIPAGIFLRGESLFNTPGAIPLYTSIRGNHTLAATNVSKFERLEFLNADPTADMFTNAGAVVVYNCIDCIFDSASSGLFFTLNFNDSYFSGCLFVGTSFQTGIAVTTSAGGIIFENCFLNNMGLTYSGGNSRFLNCQNIGPIALTTAQITCHNSTFTGDSFCVNGTGGSCSFTNCSFSCNSPNPPIQFAGSETYLANCNIVGGTGTAGLYSGACVIGAPTSTAGNVYTRTTTATDIGTDQSTFYFGVTNTSAPRTITLSTPAGLDRSWIVKDESLAAGTNNITVVAQGGGTIDGAASYVINRNGGAAQFISDGAGNFFVMNQSSAAIPAGVVTSVLGTANRITSTGGTTPVIDISGSYVGQASITTLGTVATGTWNGTVVSPTFGGTGVNNGANTLTLAGTLQTSGAFNSVFTMTGATNVTFPTSGTLSTTTGTVTSVSGTSNRVTSTGGNTPVIDISAAYVGQSSLITLGTVTTGTWNATTIGPTFGGTGLITYTTGDTIYASATNVLSKLAVGSNGQVLTLASGIPSWATPTTGTVTSVSGTTNRVTSTGGATPVIDISASYVGQSSITTLGTIATGVWNGTAVDETHGGTNQTTYATGDTLYATAANTLGKRAIGSTGNVLTVAGGIPTWAAPATFSQIATQTFIANGTYTPTAGMKYCTIECVGAGGGGGGAAASATLSAAGGGGGGGCYVRTSFSAATIGVSQSVTVGAAGTAGANTGTTGGAGGSTSVGALISAPGGAGGTGSGAASATGQMPGGAGGNLGFTAGSYNSGGQSGSNAFWISGLVVGGIGGSSGFGGGSPIQRVQITTGTVAGNTGNFVGAGGGGAVMTLNATGSVGGAGGQGFIMVTEYI